MGCTISGSISLPYPGFFSPFPHGTGCTIGDKSYLALPSGLGRFTRGSTCSVLLGYHLNSIGFLRTGLSPSMARRSSLVSLTYSIFFSTNLESNPTAWFEGDGSSDPTTLGGKPTSLGSSAFARRYLQNLFDFFSSGYLDVSVHRVTFTQPMYSAMDCWTLLQQDFSIRGSQDRHFCAAPLSVSPLSRPSSATCP